MRTYRLKLSLVVLLLGLLLAACTTDGSEPVSETPATRQTTLLLPGHEKPTQVTYEVIDGLAIFEGDIILGEVAEDGSMLQTQGVGREGDFYRWPSGVVPYRISSDLSNFMQARINRAIEHWRANTSIRLVPRTTQDSFVEFRSGTGCSSFVGKQGGMQSINLSAGCSTGAVIHEIGHAVGLWHEQSREDRDRHVEILWDNIEPGKEHNFRKHVTDGFDIGFYDYGSIMHYSAYAFSKNGQPTIRTKPPGIPIGQSSGLSAGDKGSVRTLYEGFDLRVSVLNATTPSYPGVIVKRVKTGQIVARLTRSTTLRNLAAGDYTIIAPSWDVGGPNKPVWKVYTPNLRVQKVHVPYNGGTAYLTVRYTVQDLSDPGPGPSPEPCIKWHCL